MTFRILACSLLLNVAVLCAPAQAQSDRVMRVSFAAAVTAHAADISTSMYCLGAKVCTEVNPALGWAEDKPIAFGVAKMGMASAALLATAALDRRGHRKLAFWLNVAQAVTFTSIAIRNARTTR